MSDEKQPSLRAPARLVTRFCTACNGLGTEGGKRVSAVCGPCKGTGKEHVEDSPREPSPFETGDYPEDGIDDPDYGVAPSCLGCGASLDGGVCACVDGWRLAIGDKVARVDLRNVHPETRASFLRFMMDIPEPDDDDPEEDEADEFAPCCFACGARYGHGTCACFSGRSSRHAAGKVSR